MRIENAANRNLCSKGFLWPLCYDARVTVVRQVADVLIALHQHTPAPDDGWGGWGVRGLGHPREHPHSLTGVPVSLYWLQDNSHSPLHPSHPLHPYSHYAVQPCTWRLVTRAVLFACGHSEHFEFCFVLLSSLIIQKFSRSLTLLVCAVHCCLVLYVFCW